MANLLLTNPGFESGNTSGWTADAGITFTAETFAAHDGNYGGYAVVGAGNDVYTATGSFAIVQEGLAYIGSVWVKGDGVNSSTAEIDWYDNTNTLIISNAFGSERSANWEYIRGPVVAPAGAVKAGIRIAKVGHGSGYIVQFDTASIEATGMIQGVQSIQGIHSIQF